MYLSDMNLLELSIYIANTILNTISTVFFYKLISCFVSSRKNIVFKIIIGMSIWAIHNIIIHPEDIYNVIGAFFLFILVMIICFKGSLLQRISVIFISYPLVVALNFLSEDIGLNLYLAFGETSLANTLIRFASNLIKILIWYLVFKLFYKHLPNVKTLLTTRMWKILDAICLAPLVAMFTLIIFTPQNVWMAYPAAVSSVITSLGSIYLTGYIANTVKIDLDNKNLRLQETYYNELSDNQKHIQKLRHDMNNHLNVIYTFLENDNKLEANSYYQSLSKELLVKTRVFCKNSIVNAVINSKYNLAINNQIDCFINIDLNNLLSIDDISLCSIFANTLDNAIEASLKIDDPQKRKISLKARYNNSFFSYEITNNKNEDIVKKNNIFISNKKDKKHHGIGISNIEDIVDKYSGTVDISYTNNKFSVIVLIGNV